jgi:hypothetical protein
LLTRSIALDDPFDLSFEEKLFLQRQARVRLLRGRRRDDQRARSDECPSARKRGRIRSRHAHGRVARPHPLRHPADLVLRADIGHGRDPERVRDDAAAGAAFRRRRSPRRPPLIWRSMRRICCRSRANSLPPVRRRRPNPPPCSWRAASRAPSSDAHRSRDNASRCRPPARRAGHRASRVDPNVLPPQSALIPVSLPEHRIAREGIHLFYRSIALGQRLRRADLVARTAGGQQAGGDQEALVTASA